ncbi:MAG: putative DNA binding domain-containing protein, partial [Paludibacter sp.]|nr:putative DNA binding domain-containing protein [Paludibacter sp.]
EYNRVEYKERITDTLEKEIVAFLNYIGGGIVYLGVDKHSSVVGIENADMIQLQIKDRIRNNMKLSQ